MDADIVNNDNEIITQDNNNNLQAKTYTSKQYRKKFQNPMKQDEYQVKQFWINESSLAKVKFSNQRIPFEERFTLILIER